jgi:hypothetical protein
LKKIDLFQPKITKKRKHSKILSISEILQVFMGSSITIGGREESGKNENISKSERRTANDCCPYFEPSSLRKFEDEDEFEYPRKPGAFLGAT